jgi:hypothetical protein
MIEKLKQRWNVRNGWDVLIILVVFACTGFSVFYVKRWLFELIGLTQIALLAALDCQYSDHSAAIPGYFARVGLDLGQIYILLGV